MPPGELPFGELDSVPTLGALRRQRKIAGRTELLPLTAFCGDLAPSLKGKPDVAMSLLGERRCRVPRIWLHRGLFAGQKFGADGRSIDLLFLASAGSLKKISSPRRLCEAHLVGSLLERR